MPEFAPPPPNSCHTADRPVRGRHQQGVGRCAPTHVACVLHNAVRRTAEWPGALVAGDRAVTVPPVSTGGGERPRRLTPPPQPSRLPPSKIAVPATRGRGNRLLALVVEPGRTREIDTPTRRALRCAPRRPGPARSTLHAERTRPRTTWTRWQRPLRFTDRAGPLRPAQRTSSEAVPGWSATPLPQGRPVASPWKEPGVATAP